jgi:hypothetical protein
MSEQPAPKKRGRKPKNWVPEPPAGSSNEKKKNSLALSIVHPVEENKDLSQEKGPVDPYRDPDRDRIVDLPGYFQVLQDFKKGYPSRTNVSCWWCCHPFDNHPIGIPHHYSAEKNVFKVLGCFCSFSCAYAFSKNDSLYRTTLGDLISMYRKVTGMNDMSFTNPIKPAPDRYTLKMFGGPLSIEEFRESFENERTFSTCLAPMMPWAMFIDESSGTAATRRGIANGNMKKPLRIRTAKKSEDSGVSNHPSSSSSSAGNSRRVDERTTVTQLISFL